MGRLENKGSWTERQIGMLLSYFVLIKLSVIKCLFNYDNAIFNIYDGSSKYFWLLLNYKLIIKNNYIDL